MLNWTEECSARLKRIAPIKKEIVKHERALKELRKNIEEIGSPSAINVVRDCIESEYGIKSRIEILRGEGDGWYWVIFYYPHATPKQFRYKRPELEMARMPIKVDKKKNTLLYFPRDNPLYYTYDTLRDDRSILDPKPLPETIESIYEIIKDGGSNLPPRLD